MRQGIAITSGASALAVAALGYRAWDRGAFGAPRGPAYAAWDEWRGTEADGKRRPLRATILAASPHHRPPRSFPAPPADPGGANLARARRALWRLDLRGDPLSAHQPRALFRAAHRSRSIACLRRSCLGPACPRG